MSLQEIPGTPGLAKSFGSHGIHHWQSFPDDKLYHRVTCVYGSDSPNFSPLKYYQTDAGAAGFDRKAHSLGLGLSNSLPQTAVLLGACQRGYKFNPSPRHEAGGPTGVCPLKIFQSHLELTTPLIALVLPKV